MRASTVLQVRIHSVASRLVAMRLKANQLMCWCLAHLSTMHHSHMGGLSHARPHVVQCVAWQRCLPALACCVHHRQPDSLDAQVSFCFTL